MWTHCTSVTDRQTDGQTDEQTDRITMTKTVRRIASHGKNRAEFWMFFASQIFKGQAFQKLNPRYHPASQHVA